MLKLLCTGFIGNWSAKNGGQKLPDKEFGGSRDSGIDSNDLLW